MSGAAATGTLLERSAELARIDAALADARAGRGRFVVVEGPAGIGKTALLAAARGSAADAGMSILRARATELERDFAFGIVRQLFEPPLAEASEGERAALLQATAGEAAALLRLPGASPVLAVGSPILDPTFAILHGLYWLCANLAAAGPLLIVVDDAHWADAASLRYLAFLITRLEELDVALVVANRPCESGTDEGLLTAVTTDAAAEVIRVPPLTRDAVSRLLEARLGEEPDPVFVDACMRVSDGTPFLLRGLVDVLVEFAVTPTAEGAHHVERLGARTVGRSIRLRLRGLPEHVGRLASALAVLEQGDLVLAARLAELDEGEAAEAAELLVTACIFEPGRPLRFIHPIVRSGLYSELSAAERAQGHRRAARLLAEQPGSNERVAEHLLESEPSADPWVVARLVEAARAAARSGAPEPAAVFLRRALEEPSPPADSYSVLLELGVAEASAGLADWPDHLQQAILAAPDTATAAGAAMVLASAFNRNLRSGEAVEVLERAAASLGPCDGELAVQLEAAALVAAMHDPATAPSLAARARDVRERADGEAGAPAELLAVAAYTSVLGNEPAEIGAEFALRAVAAREQAPLGPDDRPWATAATFSRTALALVCTERYERARALLDSSIAQARATGDSGQLAVSLAFRGWLALRRGDLSAAEADTRTALGSTGLPAPPLYRVLNAGVLVDTLVVAGSLAEAEQVLAPLASETEGGSLVAAALRFGRGRLRVEQGRGAEGLADFLAVGAQLGRALVTCPGFLPWRSEAALVHLALGDRESAGRLAEDELELALAFGAPRAVGIGKRVAGLVAGGERGALLLREAIESFELGDARLDRARALADLGALLRRRNRRTEARELLREALDAAHRAGARRLAGQAETELRATGARPRRVVLSGLESLTASERRVAELAGQGLTNREIAQMLFVTARTVEGHLTSVFRKLHLDSRASLQAALAERA